MIYTSAANLMPMLVAHLQPADIVLDIGCGIRPQQYLVPRTHICCEPFHQYVSVLQGLVALRTDRSYVILKAGWSEVVDLLPAKSVDTIFLCDVIEHLSKDEGLRLLEKTIPLARKQIAIFTPLGFMAQHHPDGRDAWGLQGGAWQEHKSGWEPSDFDSNWQCFVSETFHGSNNVGQLLEKPNGAFWALRTTI